MAFAVLLILAGIGFALFVDNTAGAILFAVGIAILIYVLFIAGDDDPHATAQMLSKYWGSAA